MTQTDVIILAHFAPYIDQKKSIQSIDEIFSKTQQNEWKKKMEPEREVDSPWKEQCAERNTVWRLDDCDSYTGHAGGAKVRPTTFIKNVACKANDLADRLFGLLPLSFFENVAKMTNKYAYEDGVLEKVHDDRDGIAKKRKVLVDHPLKTDGKKTPGIRHRADNKKYKFQATASFIICWVAILTIQGVLFGLFKLPSRMMWEQRPYGL